MWDKIKALFQNEDEWDEAVEVPVRGEDNTKIISLRPGSAANHEVVVMHPTSFSETLPVVRYLKERYTVIINVAAMDQDESQRFVDFVSGSAYALDGHQERVGDGIFVLTPSHINIRSKQAINTAEGITARG